MEGSSVRSNLARSEATAAALLAGSMREQGNVEVATQTLPAGQLVSLGPGRYVNRLICTELAIGEADIAHTISFFGLRHLPSSIQISGLVDDASTERLRSSGFEVDWERVVLAKSASVEAEAALMNGVTIETVGEGNLEVWLWVLASGNNASSPAARLTSDEFGRAAHEMSGATDLLARIDGSPAATGSLQPVDSVCWLGGAATSPDFRRRGLQRILLDRRIGLAARSGCELIAATAVPDTSSMRNLERVGLTLVDTQTVWTRPL